MLRSSAEITPTGERLLLAERAADRGDGLAHRRSSRVPSRAA